MPGRARRIRGPRREAGADPDAAAPSAQYLMHLAQRIHARLERDVNRFLFKRVSRRILATPPLARGALPFTLLSMVQARDVPSYLLAVKSFARFANPRRVVIVCDPSLSQVDHDLLLAHVPHAELSPAAQFTHPAIPRGGTWERLLAISQYAATDYVVQLDADTLALRPLAEVVQAVARGHGFVLGESRDQRVLTFSEIAHWAVNDHYEGPVHAHVQAVAEVALPDLGLGTELLYVRGCSGFTGFPANPRFRAALIDFSTRMGERIGGRWSEWGSEQVASNYMAANASGTAVLPFPKYATPDHAEVDSAFLHFIGYLRYRDRQYERAAAKAIRELRR